MAIDPDAVVLHKEIKTKHTKLKNALKGLHAQDIKAFLDSIFGSSSDQYSVTSHNYITSEAITWESPLQSSIGAVFNAKIKIHLNDDMECTHVDFEDKWIYGALLPLSIKLNLHEEWSAVLNHVCAISKTKATDKPLPFHNMWKESILLDYMSFGSEDASASFSSQDAWALKASMTALHEDPKGAYAQWPNFAPWLHAMETLSPAPPCEDRNSHYVVEAWQEWGATIRTLYNNAHLKKPEVPLLLPDSFSSPDIG